MKSNEEVQLPLFEPTEKQLNFHNELNVWLLQRLVTDLFNSPDRAVYSVQSSYTHHHDFGCHWGMWRVDEITASSEEHAKAIAKARWPQYNQQEIIDKRKADR